MEINLSTIETAVELLELNSTQWENSKDGKNDADFQNSLKNSRIAVNFLSGFVNYILAKDNPTAGDLEAYFTSNLIGSMRFFNALNQLDQYYLKNESSSIEPSSRSTTPMTRSTPQTMQGQSISPTPPRQSPLGSFSLFNRIPSFRSLSSRSLSSSPVPDLTPTVVEQKRNAIKLLTTWSNFFTLICAEPALVNFLGSYQATTSLEKFLKFDKYNETLEQLMQSIEHQIDVSSSSTPTIDKF